MVWQQVGRKVHCTHDDPADNINRRTCTHGHPMNDLAGILLTFLPLFLILLLANGGELARKRYL